MREANKDRKESQLYQHLGLNPGKNYEYRRLITVFKGKDKSCFYQDKVLVDQVELNSKMADQNIIKKIGIQSELFIMMSFAVLYSALCPIVPVAIFLYNIMMVRFDRTTRLNYIMRKPMEQGNGLGPWESILEFLAYSTVISNCLFIYWFKDLYAETLHESITLNLNYRRDFKYENMEMLSSVLE